MGGMRASLFLALTLSLAAQDPLLVKPYLQWGPKSKAGNLEVLWHAVDEDLPWIIQTKQHGRWQSLAKPAVKTWKTEGAEPHRIYHAALKLRPGTRQPYRLMKGDQVFFESEAQAPRAGAAQRFIVLGDSGQNTPQQKAIADRIYEQKADYVFVTGDLVYGRGRASEYRTNHFPIYNADESNPRVGSPLLRSTVMLAAPGNHDLPATVADVARLPDPLAYFLYWSQPLNGPALEPANPSAAPMDEARRAAFQAGTGDAYPRMASFWFRAGNAHWVVLDSNPYVNWQDPALQKWLEAALQKGKTATWRFVAFHHPPFNASDSHFKNQWMRLVVPILEKHKVDLVFSGHVHNYQRSAPLRFEPAQDALDKSPKDVEGKLRDASVAGDFKIDESFDGLKQTRPNGILYIVSGAGGAGLYDTTQGADKHRWQPFTRAFTSDQHSFTVVDLNDRTLKLKQMNAEGQALDSITIRK
jgi:acid phosphatase type 7